MRIENNLSMIEIIIRHFLGMGLAILGGFLGYYISPVFFIIAVFGPVLIFTAILGWCPLKGLGLIK